MEGSPRLEAPDAWARLKTSREIVSNQIITASTIKGLFFSGETASEIKGTKTNTWALPVEKTAGPTPEGDAPGGSPV